jgi:subtilase family serine protease
MAVAGQAPYTPAQISHAYGLDQIKPLAGNVPDNGAGQTIAIVDAYDDPTIRNDLQTFDSQFGLPNLTSSSLTIVNQAGGKQLPPADADWTIETALDVEWAHAMAPGASILLVEANTDYLSDLLTAVDYARRQPGVSVVSMSWGSSEFSQETQLDAYFTTPAGHQGVSFVAAAGDTGAPAGWPATSPNVLAVGGTSLKILDAAGTYRSETGWSFSSGGPSLYEVEPKFQSGVQSTSARTAPDVAYNADPNTGYYVYNSTGDGDPTGWLEVGGTSAGAPQWAAILAIADQGRAAKGRDTLRAAQADVYQLPGSDFHDIVSGFNGYYARPGYDLVTGLGTPVANRLVADLIGSKGVQAVETAAASGYGASPDSLVVQVSSRVTTRQLISDPAETPAENVLPPLVTPSEVKPELRRLLAR